MVLLILDKVKHTLIKTIFFNNKVLLESFNNEVNKVK